MTDKDNSPVALITGSVSGIGKAIATLLAKEGYRVIIHSRTSENAGKLLAEELVSAKYIQADLSKEEDRIRLIEMAVKLWGRLDILINNAGLSGIIPHADMKAASSKIWHELYEVNVVAPFHLIAEAEQALKQSRQETGRPSCVINISSHAGVRPKGASIPYAATKAALNHVTKLLAVSLAPDIRVNAIAPGLVKTPMTEAWTDAHKLWNDRAPMKRPALPEDIAQAAMLLIRSDYITGEILLSDGGLNLT